MQVSLSGSPITLIHHQHRYLKGTSIGTARKKPVMHRNESRYQIRGHSLRHHGPKTALRSDGALGRAAVSVIGGPGLAVRTTASVEAALHGSHASHPHGLMESVAFVLQGRQVKICNTKVACTERSIKLMGMVGPKVSCR